MQKSVLVLKEMQMVVNQDGTAGMQYGIGPKGAGAGAGAGGPAPDTSWWNYAKNMGLFTRPGQGPGLMNRLKGAAGFVGKPLAVLGGAFAGMDALANASQSNSLSGALNAPTGAMMTYQGLNPASYMNMPPTYGGPAPSRIRTETPDIGTATPLDSLQEQQTAEVKDTPYIEEHHKTHTVDEANTHSKPKSFTPPHPLETPETAPAPVHTPAPTKQTGLPGIVGAAENTPPPQSMVDSSLANQQVKPDVGATVDAYANLTNNQGKMGEDSSWKDALKVLDKTPVHPSIPQAAGDLPAGQIQGDNDWGTDADWDKNSPSPLSVQELEEEKRKDNLQEGIEWDNISTGFVPAFMEVYGDLLKGMSPHDVGIFASEVFLKMR